MIFYVLFIAIALVSYLVQANLKSKFERYQRVRLASGMTGRDVAEKMLCDNGIHNVKVTCTKGYLTDHYNPPTERSIFRKTSTTAALWQQQP